MSAALAWNNHIAAVPSSQLLASVASSQMTSIAFDAMYPGVNVFTSDPSKATRVNFVRNGVGGGYALLHAQFALTAGQELTTRMVAALNVRLPASATQATVRAYDQAGNVEFQTVYPRANLVPISGTTDRFNLYALAAADHSVASASLMVEVPVSITDYIEWGTAWASKAIVWPQGADAEWRLSGVDSSVVARNDVGGAASLVVPVRKVISLSKRSLSYIDALGTLGDSTALSMRDVLFEAGSSTPVIAVSSDADQHRLQVKSVYGLITRLPELGYNGGDSYGTGLTIEQMR
jgi:hypothetical protein